MLNVVKKQGEDSEWTGCVFMEVVLFRCLSRQIAEKMKSLITQNVSELCSTPSSLLVPIGGRCRCCDISVEHQLIQPPVGT